MDASLKVDAKYRSGLTYSGAVMQFKHDLRKEWPSWRFHRFDVRRDTETGEWEARAYADTHTRTESDD